MLACRHILLATVVTASVYGDAQRTGAHTSSHTSPQATESHARELIEAAVRSELDAADRDHSIWTYRDETTNAERKAVFQVVDTPEGGVRRMIEMNGHPVDDETRRKETDRIQDFIHDRSAQAKQRKADAHDDAQARDMMLMLPNAFIWTVKSETDELATLSFRPDPQFHPPNIEARVMSTMAGELILVKADNRIRTLRGALSEDVKIGYGMLGKLRQGGSFDVERREVAPHIWQITTSRVHIDGRALLFKSIGQQEDEVKSDWKPSTAKTLAEAAKQLNAD
jgi:hypothetical protein